MKPYELDRDKFDNLVHYIISKCPDKAKLGSTKLQKILWKSDTAMYKERETPITGTRYTRRQHGPAADEFLASRARLAKTGRIKYWDEQLGSGRKRTAYEAIEPPVANFLDPKEKQAVDYWIKEICLKHTAESISEETHEYAWDIIPMGSEMPLYSVFVDLIADEPSKEGMDWAIEEVRRLGLDTCDQS